eukprot:CAMPEP_0114418674 /NCGR_PEP_ID=MMETSP0103-20121206/3623_1 /TAXON_ID=37642 ORGANISM="Paraphysomonas imperforata, Strain PA2" /NCGR_SAMPLE_ID=MMETSP0103 /ASSEMBLY_ACC=CAM_ASM_000201 /LENGTH=2325 /DNA_ID=CAMNT_0001587049 /DNA_START=49 /DNA_END=7026 /DNA_ORIENTATION=+
MDHSANLGSQPFFSSVADFVEWSGGDHVIKKILIANNGIGAVKAIRSIHKWSYQTFGDEKMIQFVVMATPDDLRANAEFIRLGDEVVNVPGGSNNNNYANVNLICEIAERMNVDAVMPLWGHASEKPLLPKTLSESKRKIAFIGPPAGPMQALGDKIGSTIIAQCAGVPCSPWNGDFITGEFNNGDIPQEVYDSANVKTPEDCLACAQRIGFPCMIKASEGGGGKGIRMISEESTVLSSFRAVQGEVPGSPIFVMKLATNARHLEVQLLGDKHGNVIALSGRDCSVQRRHQKIIEEGPPMAAPANVFRQMENSAIALAKAVGYQSAGTLEFLFHEDTHEFSFLELNPRLQVEHPVTENILGINLPSCQLMVAMGIPLHRIGDVRTIYGRHPAGKDSIDFDFAEKNPFKNYCIAVRITAENPDTGFQPTSGLFAEIQFRSAIDVWGYFSVNSSGLVHEFADSQFGHLFARGPDRESARRAMVVALKELEIRGELRTTVEYVIRMLESDDFVGNHINTAWLDKRIANEKALTVSEKKSKLADSLIAICGAAVKGYQHFEDARQLFLDRLGIGQVPSIQSVTQEEQIDLILNNIKYEMECRHTGSNCVLITNNGKTERVNITLLSDGGYLLDVRGKSRLVYTKKEGNGCFRVKIDGTTYIFTPEYDPTLLRAAAAGKVARFLVPDGAHVMKGDAFVEIEVMKMYMSLKVEESGIVKFQLSEGAVLAAGDLIATMTLDHEECVVKAELYTGNESSESDEKTASSALLSPHLAFNRALVQLQTVLEGYSLAEEDILQALVTCTQSHYNKLLPAFALTEAMSVLSGRIDEDLYNNIISLKDNFLLQQDDPNAKFPSATILTAIWQKAKQMDSVQKSAFLKQMGPVWDLAEVHMHSPEVRILYMLIKFTESFLSIEKHFDDSSFTDTVNKLRKEHSGNLGVVWDICSSHVNLGNKKLLMLKVIEMMESIPLAVTSQRVKFPSGVPSRHDLNVRNLKARLTELARLKSATYTQIAFVANQVLTKQTTLTIAQRRERLHQALVEALNAADIVGHPERAIPLKKFVETNVAVRDLLQESMEEDGDYQLAYIELYIRHTYQKTHDLVNFTSGDSITDDDASSPWVGFEFLSRKFDSIPNPSTKDGVIGRHHSFSDLSIISKSSANSPGAMRLTSGPFAETMVSDVEEDDDNNNNSDLDDKRRFGLFTVVPSVDDFVRLFPSFLEKIPKLGPLNLTPANALHVCIKNGSFDSDAEASTFLSNFFTSQEDVLLQRGMRRVTVLVGNVSEHVDIHKLAMTSDVDKSNTPDNLSTFTFRCGDNFKEDMLLRHIEAPHAFHLDLPRLANFNISLEEGMLTPSGHIHLYRAVPVGKTGPVCFFARMVSFLADIKENDTETLFIDALDLMTLAKGREDAVQRGVGNNKVKAINHIFLNVVAPDIVFQPEYFETEMRRMCMKYSAKMVKLSINVVELKITSKLNIDGNPIFIRMNFTNPTGYVVKVEQYYEELRDGTTVFCSVAGSTGMWDGLAVTTPYPISQKFDTQRAAALASSDTLYAYDWMDLFEEALAEEWRSYYQARVKPGRSSSSIPALPLDIFSAQELVLTDGAGNSLPSGWTVHDAGDSVLAPMVRPRGSNDIGMVGWVITMKTPECKSGRQLVVIANDITFAAGSFGTREDLFFLKASEFARASGIPRLYLAANSGARIGMAQSLKDKFDVCWTDVNDPSKGFQYIYLTPTVHDYLLETVAEGDASKMPVLCEKKITPEGDVRYVITDIIGVEQDLGVENLMGSGLIAGETSKAYDDIFTLTLVVGRTVGIGAYLVRLGQRTIQKKVSSPIILTGFQALNKLMGQDIYTSNNQLGGPMIMSPNGVTHMLADTHMDSVRKAIQWMAFIPSTRFAPLPLLDTVDPVSREISFKPEKNKSYDPRFLLNGTTSIVNGQEVWESGFCDRGSFIEVLSDWAKTVVVGRARLGGIPLGVICTESRTAEAFIPADPADSTSQEKVMQQAGGVWFPDSAYKTAQALRDFNREDLPCIVFANWRGFSGGQRDMFDEVLKFGAMIVDAFVAYEQPLFVYIPPHAELRGGAWVVVDSTINSDVMEFYAAEDARGGVLEATGAASIKYRDKEIRQTATRVDPVLEQLNNEMKACEDEAEKKILSSKIFHREKLVLGVFRQIAVHFADLHDTPGRMKAKGVIRRQVQWAQARNFFFWRLRRKLAEFDIARMMRDVDSTEFKSKQKAIALLKSWFVEQASSSAESSDAVWEDDVKMMKWLKDNTSYIRDRLKALKEENSGRRLAALLADVIQPAESPSSDFMAAAFSGMSKEDTSKFIAQLTEMNSSRK